MVYSYSNKYKPWFIVISFIRQSLKSLTYALFILMVYRVYSVYSNINLVNDNINSNSYRNRKASVTSHFLKPLQ